MKGCSDYWRTNLRQHLDDAFVRRIQSIVEFPFPDVEQRRQIWAVTFPHRGAGWDDVDFGILAREIKLPAAASRTSPWPLHFRPQMTVAPFK